MNKIIYKLEKYTHKFKHAQNDIDVNLYMRKIDHYITLSKQYGGNDEVNRIINESKLVLKNKLNDKNLIHAYDKNDVDMKLKTLKTKFNEEIVPKYNALVVEKDKLCNNTIELTNQMKNIKSGCTTEELDLKTEELLNDKKFIESICKNTSILPTKTIPQPVPKPISIQSPIPQPVPKPIPVSSPQPVPKPIPVSSHQPVPKPIPVSSPQPVPKPIPVSSPQPIPIASPQPVPKPIPVASPTSQPVPKPIPVTSPTSKPIPVTSPTLQPLPTKAIPSEESQYVSNNLDDLNMKITGLITNINNKIKANKSYTLNDQDKKDFVSLINTLRNFIKDSKNKLEHANIKSKTVGKLLKELFDIDIIKKFFLGPTFKFALIGELELYDCEDYCTKKIVSLFDQVTDKSVQQKIANSFSYIQK